MGKSLSRHQALRSGEQVKQRGREASKTLTRHERGATKRPSLMNFVKGYARGNMPSTLDGKKKEMIIHLMKFADSYLSKCILGYYNKAED